jgi:hypothetical protein
MSFDLNQEHEFTREIGIARDFSIVKDAINGNTICSIVIIISISHLCVVIRDIQDNWSWGRVPERWLIA